MRREIEEEASIFMEEIKPTQIWQKRFQYYSPKGKFFDYDQTFWLLDGPAMEQYFFEGEVKPEDAASARWVPVAELKNLQIHYVHAQAFKAFGVI